MALAARLNNFNSTRRTLLSRVRNPDDQESWKVFFDTYSRLVYSVAMRAGLSDCEAQEVVQETFIALARKMPEFKYDPAVGSFKGWLIKTTQNKVTDQFRKRKHQAPKKAAMGTERRTGTIERIPDPASLDLDKCCEDEWKKHLFQQAVERVKQRVSARQFQIFDLYVLKEWPVQKVSETLGINRARVFMAKHRLLLQVKKELKSLAKVKEGK